MKDETMNRIQQEPDAYALAKEEWLVNRNPNFKAYYEWFHCKRDSQSQRMKTLCKRMVGLHNRKYPGTTKRYNYKQMGELLGCSSATVGDIINGKREISDKMYETINKNLDELGL